MIVIRLHTKQANLGNPIWIWLINQQTVIKSGCIVSTDPIKISFPMLGTAGLMIKLSHWCPAGIIPDGSGVPTGTPLSDPPLVEMISEDPVLRNTKLIAEAWDCDGLFQVPSCILPYAVVFDTNIRPQ